MGRVLTIAAGIICIVLWLVLRTWGRLGRVDDSTSRLMAYAMLQTLARIAGCLFFWAGVGVFLYILLSR